MIFLGNPASRHIETWRALYARRGRNVSALFTIHPRPRQFPLERRAAFGGKLVSYVVLGLRLRWSRVRGVVHAHGASGYGLAALVSGRPYVVTIYGSEVLAEQGRVYAAMVARVLRRASIVTVTSPAAAWRVREIAPGLGGRVLCFHTGIDPAQLEGLASQRASRPIPGPVRVLCIRNCAPQYRTREVLAAVRSVAGHAPPFRLTVPLGNGDPAYFASLRAEFPDPWIDYVGATLPHAAFLAAIRDADICINFPRSDQTSATLIEAVYFDRLILTADLDAYAALFAETADYAGWRVVRDESELARAFAAAIASIALRADGVETNASAGASGAQAIARHYGPAAAARHLDPILELQR